MPDNPGQLVTLLGCEIKWTQSRLTVLHPVHGRLRVRLRGNCPVLPVTQALTLIGELEQARVRQFQKTVDGLQAQVRTLREQGRDAGIGNIIPVLSVKKEAGRLWRDSCVDVPRCQCSS